MIFKILLYSCLIFSFKAFSFDKDLKIESDRIPTEFRLLFDSMKIEIKTPKEKMLFVGLLQELDDNLGSLEKEHIFLLLKSEVIKNLLEHQFDKVRQFDVSNLLVQRLTEAHEQKQKYLTPFSEWLWRSILAELKQRQKMGLITDRSFNPRSFEGGRLSDALRFEKYLAYILPWIDRMDSLTASQFNDLTKEVSWIILKRINERSLLFKRYAATATTGTKIKLFNIPQHLLTMTPQERDKARPAEELNLKDLSQKAKSEAVESLEKITPNDMSPISEDVFEAIDKEITPKAKNP